MMTHLTIFRHPDVPCDSQAIYLSLDEIKATRGGRLTAIACDLLKQRAGDERADETLRAIRSVTMTRWGWGRA